jgi:hypothetical protein
VPGDPDLFPGKQFTYWVCARRFGWTPSQVDAELEERPVLMEWIVNIDEVVRAVRGD